MYVNVEKGTTMLKFGKTGNISMTMVKMLHQHVIGVGCWNRQNRKIRATMKEERGHQ